MSAVKTEIHAGISSDAVRAKTGKGWSEWFALLDKAKADEWAHKEIANYLHDKCDCGDWWSQMVTVGYEQARGLRVKHQTADGFTAGVSKTIAVPVKFLYKACFDAKERAKWLPDADRVAIRPSTANKYLRFVWIDGKSVIQANFYSKGTKKSQVSIERRKLPSVKAVAQVKAYWSKALNKLKELLEQATAA
jgi:hypothetical protein